jgi:ribosomal protein S8
MSNNFLLASLIGKINFGLKHKKYSIVEKKSKVIINILKILFKQNIIKNYYLLNNNYFIIFLKYKINNFSLIKKINIVSKPGKKIYISNYKLKSLLYKNYFNFYILSTSLGILDGETALNKNLGGELLLKITF